MDKSLMGARNYLVRYRQPDGICCHPKPDVSYANANLRKDIIRIHTNIIFACASFHLPTERVSETELF